MRIILGLIALFTLNAWASFPTDSLTYEGSGKCQYKDGKKCSYTIKRTFTADKKGYEAEYVYPNGKKCKIQLTQAEKSDGNFDLTYKGKKVGSGHCSDHVCNFKTDYVSECGPTKSDMAFVFVDDKMISHGEFHNSQFEDIATSDDELTDL